MYLALLVLKLQVSLIPEALLGRYISLVNLNEGLSSLMKITRDFHRDLTNFGTLLFYSY